MSAVLPVRKLVAALAAIAGAAMLSSATPARAHAAAPPTGPSCLAHPGDTIELNRRWRVFYAAHQPRDGEWVDVCRRGATAPTKLLRIDADGCKACAAWGSFDLHGDRLLMQRMRSTDDGNEIYQHQLLDLPSGNVVEIGPEVAKFGEDEREDAWATFAPNGAVLAGYGQYDDDNEVIPGTTRAWLADRDGIRPRALPDGDVVGSRGGHGRRAGFYFATARSATRITADGALRTGFHRDPAIRHVANPHRHDPARPQGPRLETRPFLYDDGSELSLSRRGTAGELNFSFLGSDRNDRRIRPAGPGWGDVRVIAASQHHLLLRGHFADDPGRLRVRRTHILTFSYEGDVDPRLIPTRPGSLAMYGDAVVAVEPGGLRIWDGKAARTVDVPGAHDLAEGPEAMIVTDRTGRVRLIPIRG